jgi:hypothetical protein
MGHEIQEGDVSTFLRDLKSFLNDREQYIREAKYISGVLDKMIGEYRSVDTTGRAHSFEGARAELFNEVDFYELYPEEFRGTM